MVSTPHLTLKYPIKNRGVGVIKADQQVARKGYEDSLNEKMNKGARMTTSITHEVNYLELDPREDFQDRQPQQAERLKSVVVGDVPNKTTQIGTTVAKEFEQQLVEVLKKNPDAFAWTAADMPEVDPNFLCHRLYVDPKARLVAQWKKKFGDDKRKAMAEETKSLVEAGFIREIKYPTWLVNMAMVKKANGKWRLCVDYTDLNKVCPKDSYPLPSIDRLVDGASGYKILSFLGAYLGYNQIPMYSPDEEKTIFIMERASYCYRVMPFMLKNAGATY